MTESEDGSQALAISQKYPDIWAEMVLHGCDFETGKQYLQLRKLKAENSESESAVTERKNERKKSLREKAEILFDQISEDHKEDKEKIQELKNNLIEAINEVNTEKIAWEKEFIEAWIKKADYLNEEWKKRLDIVKELGKILEVSIANTGKAFDFYNEMGKKYESALIEHNLKIAEMTKGYNEAVDALNRRMR